MNILEYGSLAASIGGPSHSLQLMVRGLCEAGEECEVVMPPLASGDRLCGDGLKVHYLPRCHGHFQYSNGIGRALARLKRPEVCHVHGLWQYPNHAMCVYARRHHIPYVISPRGMLYPQGIKDHSMCLKYLALLLWQKKDLSHAGCLHATCREELKVLRDMGLRNPVAVIPNAVDLAGGVTPPAPPRDRFRVGYLGRLHPIKRVETLIRAFAAVDLPNSELLIAGGGEPEYEKFLHGECERLGLENVSFLGFLHGEEKRAALRRMSLLVVPSHFESFCNVVIEALAEGIPVVASRGTPWRELEQHRCGWWIDNSVEEVSRILREAHALPDAERIAMGEAGQKLLLERYSVDRTTEQWRAVYRWLAGGGMRPDCVFD